MREPLVSICCLTYNHEPYIRQCLEGFLMQKVNFRFEVLIHDDASTDKTPQIIHEYEKKYPTIIKPIYQKENQYSKGIKVTTVYQFPRVKGKYIAFCEGDDYWTDKNKLQKQIDFLENNIKYVLTFHDIFLIDFSGKLLTSELFRDIHRKDLSPSELLSGSYVPLQSLCVRSALIKTIPPIIKHVYNGDTFISAYLGLFGPAKYLSEIKPSAYRLHSKGIWTSINDLQKINNNINTFKSVRKISPVSKKIYVNYALAKFANSLLIENIKQKKSVITLINNYLQFSILCIIAFRILYFFKKSIRLFSYIINNDE